MRDTVALAGVLVGFCLLLVHLTPPREGVDFHPAALTARAAALRPALEEVLGESLGPPVVVRVATFEQMARMLAREAAAMSGESQEALVERLRPLARFIFAKVELATGHVHVVPETFRWVSKDEDATRDVWGEAFLDVILLHEMVHVYQHRRRDLVALFRDVRIGEEPFVCRNSVAEGHAQYVSRRAASVAGRDRAFDLADLVVTGVADGEEGLASAIVFPYLRGEQCFTAVAKEYGYAAAVDLMFAEPPRTILAVTRPRREYPVLKVSADLDKAVRGLDRLVTDERGNAAVATLHRHTLEVYFDPKPPLDGFLRGRYVRGPGRDPSIWLCLMRDAAAARTLGERFTAGAAADALAREAFAHGRVAGLVEVRGGPPHAERARRTVVRVRELLRAASEGSPWTGLGMADAQAACVASLGDPAWGVRWRAARNLGRVEPRAPGVREALERALLDGDPSVRLAALRSLRARGWLEAEALVDDPDWEVRAEARR